MKRDSRCEDLINDGEISTCSSWDTESPFKMQSRKVRYLIIFFFRFYWFFLHNTFFQRKVKYRRVIIESDSDDGERVNNSLYLKSVQNNIFFLTITM